MEKHKLILSLALVMVVLGGFGTAWGQSAVVAPDEVTLRPGQSIQFHAQAFNQAGQPVRSHFRWQVLPPDLGKISDDGLFVAGREHGVGKVLAITTVNGKLVAAGARVKVVPREKPKIRLFVFPPKAVVPPGDTMRYHAVAVTPDSHRIHIDRVHWEVLPMHLGHIGRHGLFVAGRTQGQGEVVAAVEIHGNVYKATADVIVAERPSGAIAGNVTDEMTTETIEGARMTAYRIGNIHWSRHARTDSLGNYVIDHLIPGLYVVKGQARGYIPEFYDDAVSWLEANPFWVAADDTSDGIDFALLPGGRISGHVVADEDSSDIDGAHITAALVVNDQIHYHTQTDSSGNYTLEGMLSGDYVVLARKGGFKREYYDDAPTFPEADFVGVTAPNEESGIDFGLATASAIVGRVTAEATGDPIAGARVMAFRRRHITSDHPPGTLRDLLQTRTNDNGEYVLPAHPSKYLVTAIMEGYAPEWYQEKERPGDADTVIVAEDQHTMGIDFTLGALGAIAGTVVDSSDGSAIAGAKVSAFLLNALAASPVHDVAYETESGDDGTYLLENLRPGRYIVKAAARGYLTEFFENARRPHDATPVKVKVDSVSQPVDFDLIAGGAIAGAVADSTTGDPIAGALVEVFQKRVDFYRRGYTRDDGTYEIAGLPTGKYLVRVKADGYYKQWWDHVEHHGEATPVEVAAPEVTSDIDFDLAPKHYHRGTIAGTVVSDDGDAPIFGAVLAAIRVEGGRPKFALTGPDGHYAITGLRRGHYVVLADARGYLGEFYDDVLNWFDATPVEVVEGEVSGGIDFGLRARQRGPHSISGFVRSASDGSYIEGATLFAEFQDGALAMAVTDENGYYLIPELPAGEYRIRASAVAFDDQTYGEGGGGAAATVDVNDGNSAMDIDLDLTPSTASAVNGQTSALPGAYGLAQNYPNPFAVPGSPMTHIGYQLPATGKVSLKVYNLMGQVVRTLVDTEMAAGYHTAMWDGRDQSGRPMGAGVYFYQVRVNGYTSMKRMILMR